MHWQYSDTNHSDHCCSLHTRGREVVRVRIFSKKILQIFLFSSKFILAGARNLRKLNAVQRQIVKTVEHPKFRPPVVYFDVSIAVLDKVFKIKVSDLVQLNS